MMYKRYRNATSPKVYLLDVKDSFIKDLQRMRRDKEGLARFAEDFKLFKVETGVL